MSEMTTQTRLLHHLDAGCLTIEQISEELELSRKQISQAATGLIRKGLLERAEIGCFRLTGEGAAAKARGEQISYGPKGPYSEVKKALPNTLRQRAWNVMRIRRKFAIPDLLVAAALGEERMAHDNLQKFCRALRAAGVLRQLPGKQRGTALSSPGYARFALLNDLGPIAPSYRHSRKALFDHNAKEELPCG
ncbi:MarR family transcriptional regulator [Roseobacteraceae bacterium NS-SX3]